jgi:hypothetical protein
LAYKGTGPDAAFKSGTPGDTIDGFQFTYVPGSSNDTAADSNKGVTITGLQIGGQTIVPGRKASGNYANIYAFGALGNTDGDIPMPGSTPAIIGTVTFSFANAAQNVALTPTIKTMLIQVRGTQHPQWIVKAPESGSDASEYPLGEGGYITDGTPYGGYTMPTDFGDDNTDYSAYVDGTAKTYPIYVNPHYNVTVEHFQANSTTGVAEKITDATSTVTYYFDTQDLPTPDTGKLPYNTLTNEPNIPGYTFKGWMVTENKDDNNNSSGTWDAYTGSDGNWVQTKSYPKVDAVPSAATTTEWTKKNSTVTAWDAKNNADPAVAFVDFNIRGNAITGNPSAVADGVKFIPVDTTTTETVSENDEQETVHVTKIPTGYVGPIKLTPVYIRNVYAVKFDADKAENFNNYGSKARFGAAEASSNDNYAARTRTDYYTIEDLVDENGNATDYLKIAYIDDVAHPLHIVAGSNHDLQKPGYKFVGWVPSGFGAGDEVDDKTIEGTYKWTAPYETRVNKTNVIRSDAQRMRYGALTLTAEWELDIYFAKVNYWFGGEANALIMVAVPNANRVETYTYECESKDAAGTATKFAMFEITATDQKNAYMDAAMTASDADSNHPDQYGGYTITSAFFKREGEPLGSYAAAYHLFVYIADASTTEAKITLNEATDTTGNNDFPYNGDVDGSGFVSVADFGNVDTLLNDDSEETDHIFAFTTRDGVEARLKADKSTATDTKDPMKEGTNEFLRAFASIKDVKEIYNVMGYGA